MDGIEVHVKIGGESFLLHRTESSVSNIRGSSRTVNGYAATNGNGKGSYHWIFVPSDVVGGLEWCSGGSSKEIKFKDVKIGPRYFEWAKEWWLNVE